MIKPKMLYKGDTIGIVSPASISDSDSIDKAVNSFIRRGYNVKLATSCTSKYGYLSGTDKSRADGINEMFSDNKIDAIFSLRGGYGSPRILDLLDYEMIKNNPKIFVGYSDITAIHIALNQKCGLATLHGPMATAVGGGLDEFSKKSLYRQLEKDEPYGLIKNPKTIPIKTVVEGNTAGLLCGGNLSLICATLGTEYEIDTTGKILVIEDVSEALYRIDRMLIQLKLAGKLSKASGIVFGSFSQISNTRDTATDFTLEDIIFEIVKPLNIPTVMNYQIGHCSPSISIPLGLNASLDATNKKLEILESLCIKK